MGGVRASPILGKRGEIVVYAPGVVFRRADRSGVRRYAYDDMVRRYRDGPGAGDRSRPDSLSVPAKLA